MTCKREEDPGFEETNNAEQSDASENQGTGNLDCREIEQGAKRKGREQKERSVDTRREARKIMPAESSVMLLKNTWRGISRRMGNTKAETIAKTCQSTFPISEFTGVVADSPGFDVTLGIGEMDEPVFILWLRLPLSRIGFRRQSMPRNGGRRSWPMRPWRCRSIPPIRPPSIFLNRFIHDFYSATAGHRRGALDPGSVAS